MKKLLAIAFVLLCSCNEEATPVVPLPEVVANDVDGGSDSLVDANDVQLDQGIEATDDVEDAGDSGVPDTGDIPLADIDVGQDEGSDTQPDVADTDTTEINADIELDDSVDADAAPDTDVAPNDAAELELDSAADTADTDSTPDVTEETLEDTGTEIADESPDVADESVETMDVANDEGPDAADTDTGDGPSTCTTVDGFNESEQFLGGGLTAGVLYAFQYVPSETFTLSNIQMFTHAPDGDAEINVGLHADNNDAPVETPLATSSLIVGPTLDWQDLPLDTPIEVQAGTTYWVSMTTPTAVELPRAADGILVTHTLGVSFDNLFGLFEENWMLRYQECP